MVKTAYYDGKDLLPMPEQLDKVNLIPYNSSNGPMIVNNFAVNLRCKGNFIAKCMARKAYTNYYEGRCCGRCTFRCYKLFTRVFLGCCMNGVCCCC